MSTATPGSSSDSDSAARSGAGSVSICSCVTTVETSVLVASMIGASPVTVTDSCSVESAELEVARVFLTDLQRDVLDRDRLEARKFRRQVVAARRKAADAKLAVRFGDRRADRAAFGVLDGEGDAGKNAAL